MKVLAQAIGFIGMIFVFAAFQQKEKKRILLVQAAAGVVFTVHFILLGAFTGAVMNVIEVARNAAFCKKGGKHQTRIFAAAFMLAFSVLGVLTWQNWFSLLPIVAMNLSTLVFCMENPRHIRICYVPVSVGWLIYNVTAFSIAGILTESFCLLSILIALFRYDILHIAKEESDILI